MSALVYCPFPDRQSAQAASRRLLDEGLIACANLLGEVESIYAWKGEVGESKEIGVLFKTDARLLERAVERIAALHPYETPAVMGWRCEAAQATRDWLSTLAGGQGQGAA